MRSERGGNLGRRSRENHDDLAADVDASEIIIILLRDFEAIANENERRFDLGRRHDAWADDSGFTKRHRFALAVVEYGQAAILLFHQSAEELCGFLEILPSGGVSAVAFLYVSVA